MFEKKYFKNSLDGKFLGFRMPGAGFEPAISRYPRNTVEHAILPYEPCALTS